jgi:hypothetical protein
MRKLVAAILFVGSLLGSSTVYAWNDCGPGCHSTISGACVVDGWGFLPPGVRNECPAGAHARPPCPRGFVWRFKACFPH